jgi:hypothetical protein
VLSEFGENVLFGRKYRVIVSDINGIGIDVSTLRCTFQIEKSLSETPNYAEIVLYNLSAQTENSIIKEGAKVILEAGYQNPQYGLIFSGDIVQPLRGKEDNTTYTLTLVSQDGDLFYNKGIINASFRAGQTQRDVLENIAKQSTNALEIGQLSDNLTPTALPRGKALFGLTRDYFRQIAKSEQAAFYINNNKIDFVKAMDLPTNEIIKLNGKSGLIGMPEQTEEGIQATCLLNPLLDLNKMVAIDLSSIQRQKADRNNELKNIEGSGVFKIIKIVHKGDIRGDEWYTEFTAVAQTGAVPVTGDCMR